MEAPKVGVMVFAITTRVDIAKKIAAVSIDALKKAFTPVIVGDIISDSNQAQRLSETFNEKKLDATIIIASTVGTAVQMLVAAKTLKTPILIWVPYPEEHALPTVLQVLDSLRNVGIQYKFIYGDPESDETIREIARFVKVASTIRRLRGSRIGQIGYKRPELICAVFDDRELFMNFGIETIQIDMMDILSIYRNIPKASVTSLTSKLLKSVSDLIDATIEDLERAVKLYLAVKELVKKYDLDSVAINGYPKFDNINTSAALACAMLTDEGIMSNYEGDVISAVTMLILHFLTGKPVFLAEPYKIDKKKGTIFFFHRSAPMSLASDAMSIKLFRPTILMNVPLKMNEVTIARLHGKDLKLHVSVGKAVQLIDHESKAMSEIEVKLRVNANTFIENAIGNHYSIVPGNYLEELRIFCDLIKADIIIT